MFDPRVGAGVELKDGGLVVGETAGLFVGVPILLIRVGTCVLATWEGCAVGSFKGMPVGASVGPSVGKFVGAPVQYSGVAST
eukprot:scaffold683_cov164-Amphora_coffeaeformis.AAC.7